MARFVHAPTSGVAASHSSAPAAVDLDHLPLAGSLPRA